MKYHTCVDCLLKERLLMSTSKKFEYDDDDHKPVVDEKE
jgi:hypothetical protein